MPRLEAASDGFHSLGSQRTASVAPPAVRCPHADRQTRSMPGADDRPFPRAIMAAIASLSSSKCLSVSAALRSR